MEGSQPSDNLNEYVPNFLLLDVGFSFLVAADLLEHVSVVCVLHHQAQAGRRLINERLLEPNHVRLVNTGQDSHFIQSILFLFFGQLEHFDLLQGVDVVIVKSFDFVNRTVGPIP